MEPSKKRFSVWESPDNGETWPEQFDAITIKQEVTRCLTAKEIRRWIDKYYGIPCNRAADHLYGVIVHREMNENQSVVMLDVARAYHHVHLLVSEVTGSSRYGYQAGKIELFGENQIGTIGSGDFLTYFCVQQDFVPVEGEILGMMVAALRDNFRG